jgi:hypothetical protein
LAEFTGQALEGFFLIDAGFGLDLRDAVGNLLGNGGPRA